jgi:hypothetical protein
MKSLFATLTGAMLLLTLGAGPAAAARVTITGEVIDSWCYLTEIMYPLPSARRITNAPSGAPPAAFPWASSMTTAGSTSC